MAAGRNEKPQGTSTGERGCQKWTSPKKQGGNGLSPQVNGPCILCRWEVVMGRCQWGRYGMPRVVLSKILFFGKSVNTKWLLILLEMTMIENDTLKFHYFIAENEDQIQVSMISCLLDWVRRIEKAHPLHLFLCKEGYTHLRAMHIFYYTKSPIQL